MFCDFGVFGRLATINVGEWFLEAVAEDISSVDDVSQSSVLLLDSPSNEAMLTASCDKPKGCLQKRRLWRVISKY